MKTADAIRALSALAQDSRLAIFRHLVEAGPDGQFAGLIGETLELPAATLSFHLKELSRAGLIVSEQRGRFIRYVADFTTTNALVGYLTKNCCGGKPELCCPPARKKKPGRAQSMRRRTP